MKEEKTVIGSDKMLILTRRVGETYYITVPPNLPKESQITVTILGVKGNQVRVGTVAEPHVAIDREEVHERKMAEKAEDEKNAKR